MKKLTLLVVLTFTFQWMAFSQQGCCPNGIEFSCQADIDNFQSNHPGCTQITGDVLILGDYISNLNGLNKITHIHGSLRIGDNWDGNPQLTSLSGLETLTWIGDCLMVQNNDALTNLSGLDHLQSIKWNLWVCGNSSMVDLQGMNSLTSIGGDINIMGNEVMVNLAGLESLNRINDRLTIGSNEFFNANGNLTNLKGLENVTAIDGGLEISGDNGLTDLSGLEQVTTIGDYVMFYNCGLQSLHGLENLTSIDGGLEASYTKFEDFSPLIHLTSIAGRLEIYTNQELTSLSGLENIDPESINELNITYNTALKSCTVKSICEHLSHHDLDINIGYNGAGCANEEQVREACENAHGINDIDANQGFRVFPNPAINEITISSTVCITLLQTNIYNQAGQIVLAREGHTETLDISILPKGIYIIELVSKQSTSKEILIKE